MLKVNNSPINIDNNQDKYKLDVNEITGKVCFQIKNCDSDDEADYLIKLENEAGSSQCSAALTVEKSEAKKNKRKVRFSLPTDSDVFLIKPVNQIPLPPIDPQISDYVTTSLKLNWLASPSDTHDYTKELSEIPVANEKDEDLEVTYTIEFRSSKSYSWSVFKTNIKALNTQIDDLLPGLIYSFRVRAENVNGVSEPSSAVSTKNLLDKNDAANKKSKEDVPVVRKKVSIGVTEKPSIVSDSHDIRYYIEGEPAVVSILILGYPEPNVKWIRNDVELVSDLETYKIFSDKLGYHTLEIPFACEKDEGPYQICAENEHGIMNHTFYLQC